MVENLRLVGPKVLTSADSNVTSSFSLPTSDSSAWCTTENSECIDAAKIDESGDDSYGGYYNWYAATAGSGTYSLTSGEAPESICANGWRLPTGASGGEINELLETYQSMSNVLVQPTELLLSGTRVAVGFEGLGTQSRYWTNTAYNSTRAYLLIGNADSGEVSGSVKYYGRTMRCLAQ